jgi:hypothetical protein
LEEQKALRESEIFSHEAVSLKTAGTRRKQCLVSFESDSPHETGGHAGEFFATVSHRLNDQAEAPGEDLFVNDAREVIRTADIKREGRQIYFIEGLTAGGL